MPPSGAFWELFGCLGPRRDVLSPLDLRCPVPIPVPKKAGTSAGLRLILKARGFRVELKAAGHCREPRRPRRRRTRLALRPRSRA